MRRISPLRWILKDLWAQRATYGLTLLFLMLLFSATGFVLIFKDSTQSFAQKKIRESLAADVEVSASRAFSEKETALIRRLLSPTHETFQIRVRTVAVGREKSLLAEIEGIEPQFPLEGELSFEGEPLTTTRENPAWVDRGLIEGLALQRGNTFQLGKARFSVAGIISKDTTSGLSPFGFSAKIYVRHSDLEETGLLQAGNQVSYRRYYLLPKENLQERLQQLKAQLSPDDFFVRSPEDGSFQIQRTLDIVQKSVGLISLLLILLSLLAGYFIFQSQAFSQMNAMAILRSIGLRTSRVLSLYLSELLILLVLALIMSSALWFFLLPLGEDYFRRVGIPDFIWVYELPTLGTFALSVVLVTAALSVPLALSIERAQITTLFQSEVRTKLIDRWSAGGLLLVAFLVSWLVSESLSTASLFLGLVALLVTGLSHLGPLMGRFLSRRSSGFIRTSFVQLASARISTRLGFVVLIFIVFVMQFVPHLYQSVVSEVQVKTNTSAPLFFAINIQEEDLSPLRSFVEGKGAVLEHESPMILGRLIKKNGEPIEENFFRRIPVRLSYRDQLLSSETVVAGKYPAGPYEASLSTLPSLSMEDRYARRWGFSLGDRLTFNILGTEIEARIDSFRKIDWLQFQPNFFIQFQTGVLEDAPKTFLATITPDRVRNRTQLFRELTEGFPGLSLIDISQSVARGLEIVNKVEASLRLLSQFAVLFCIFVFLFLFYDQVRSRRDEVKLLLIEGGSRGRVFLMYAFEFCTTLAAAWILSSLLAIGFVWVILRSTFESNLSISGMAVLGSLGICAALLVAMLVIFTRLTKIRQI